MKYRNILVTGGRGFIMFNALRRWKELYPEARFSCIDADTYADRFMEEEKNSWLDANGISRRKLVLGEPGAFVELGWLIQKKGIDAIVHAAAESHVDNSIKNPGIFYRSNVLGTVDVLEAARRNGVRVHVVSTDEVYGETSRSDWYLQHSGDEYTMPIRPEDKPLRPSSPYSSSKAGADLAALSYVRTFGTDVTVSRCTNNAGRWQHDEKLIGTVVSKAVNGERIPVYGEGLQRRHWIDVDDHNDAVWKILQEGEQGRIYNIGPGRENYLTNIELVRFILKRLGRPESLIEHVQDRPGHDATYYLTPSDPEFLPRPKPYPEFLPGIIDWYAERFEGKTV